MYINVQSFLFVQRLKVQPSNRCILGCRSVVDTGAQVGRPNRVLNFIPAMPMRALLLFFICGAFAHGILPNKSDEKPATWAANLPVAKFVGETQKTEHSENRKAQPAPSSPPSGSARPTAMLIGLESVESPSNASRSTSPTFLGSKESKGSNQSLQSNAASQVTAPPQAAPIQVAQKPQSTAQSAKVASAASAASAASPKPVTIQPGSPGAATHETKILPKVPADRTEIAKESNVASSAHKKTINAPAQPPPKEAAPLPPKVASALPVKEAQVSPVTPTEASPLPAKEAKPSSGAPSIPVDATKALQDASQGAPLLQGRIGPEWHTWHIGKIWPELGGLEKLLAGITFMSMLKAFCMAGNILVQISPYPQVQRWEATGCTGDSDAAPYVSIAFGGWQWCYYGLFAFFVTKRSGFLILVHSNCLGAVLGTYYSIAFYRNCKHDHSLGGLQRYASAVIMLVLFQLCSLAVLPVERALFVTGLISSFCSFIGAISVLVSLPRVIRTHDSSSIPALLVSANTVSSIVWCICGWMLDDPLIAAPNIVGCVSGAICLTLKYMYPHEGSAKGHNFQESAPITPKSITNCRSEAKQVSKPVTYQSCDTGGTL